MSSLIVEVCKVIKIEKHPNADKLDIATVKGWSCIVGKDNYKVGDLVIYCPPDSIIPDSIIDQYKLEFLKKNGRVETIKLRKYISQGLILDLSCLDNPTRAEEGQDVGKILNIIKYEPPVSCNLQGKGKKPTKKKANPLFDKYTDIENIKNYNTVFKEDDEVVITEKIHGTNFRAGNLLRYKNNLLGKIMSFFFGKYEFVYGSHNVQKRVANVKMGFYGEDVYGKIAKKYNLKKIIPEDYILYGEIYGKGIQELEYEMKDIDVVFFDVKYKGEYLDWSEFLMFCSCRVLPIVPVLHIGRLGDKDIKKLTEGCSILSFRRNMMKEQIREGCVVKSIIEENNHRVGRKILKSINTEYLCSKNRTEFK